MKKDLLKDAIADAKAVRETALANAKLALEEAFAPKLQRMLSAKLQQEMNDDEECNDDEEVEETLDSSEIGAGEEPEVDNDTKDSGEIKKEEAPVDVDADDEENDEEEVTEEVPPVTDDEDKDDDEVELESIIKELDGEESEEEMDDDEEINIDEIIKSLREDDSFTGDGTPDEEADKESQDAEVKETTEKTPAPVVKEENGEEEVEDEKDEVEEGKYKKMKEELEEAKSELQESYKAIETMRSTLNETNLLNAKLLYSNKLFKTYDLNENQKRKVIDNFDRAQSIREVKLVYATLAESFKTPVKKKINESVASKPIGSTAPKKEILDESVDFVSRMKKLAGIKVKK